MKEIIHKIAIEFVAHKKTRLNSWSNWYLDLNNDYVEKIMFKNKPKVLDDILSKHSRGEIDVPTELEILMLEEAEHLIQEIYDNSEGAIELYKLFKSNLMRNNLM